MTYELASLAVLVGAAWLIARGAIRSTTIAELEVRNGELRVLRGGIALAVLRDLRDVVANPQVRSARITLTRDHGAASVRVIGDVSEAQTQQIRNVVGSVPFAKLINAPKR